MARLPKADEEAIKRTLSEPPQPARNWRPLVEKLEADPERREALLAELASLDEMERAYRKLMLRGNAGAGRNMLEVKKLRDKLLALSEHPEQVADDGLVDLPDWVPHVEADDPSAGADTALSEDLAAAVGPKAVAGGS